MQAEPADISLEHPAATRPAARRLRGRTVVVASLLLAAGITAALIPLAVDRDQAGSAAGSPTGASSGPGSAPPTDRASASPAPSTTVGPTTVPEGFRAYRDPSGFSLAIPPDWSVRRTDGLVDFSDPAATRLLRIEPLTTAVGDPYNYWVAREPSLAGSLPGYDFERLSTVQYRGWPSADLTFTYLRAGVRVRVLNRITSPSPGQAYVLSWSTPERRWGDNEVLFDVFTHTLAPAR